MIRCYITDRRSLADQRSLEDTIAANLQAGVDWIQIREKDLSSRELFNLVERVLALRNPQGSKILINSQVDVALATGAAGVHLPACSPPPRAWSHPDILWGVSCHTLEEVQDAEQSGAGYVLFGPVFAPLSKASDLDPRGLPGLEQAARAVRIPVLALGGITSNNAQLCMEQGAAGIAGITLFQH